MTIDELSEMADECAADKSNARRMVGGRYAQKAVRELRAGHVADARSRLNEAIRHCPGFTVAANLLLSATRAEAGRAGAAARWQGVVREPTVKVRVYAADAATLKARPGSIAENVRRLLKGE